MHESMHFTTRYALNNILWCDGHVFTGYEVYTDAWQTAGAVVLARAQEQLMWVTALCQVAEDDMSPEDGATEPTNDLAEMAAHLAYSGARTGPMCETCWIYCRPRACASRTGLETGLGQASCAARAYLSLCHKGSFKIFPTQSVHVRGQSGHLGTKGQTGSHTTRRCW